jgi:hypothetical protein
MRNFLRTPRAANSSIDVRASLEDRRERIVFVILRNLIPIIGILFLGWSAQNLIVLYFVDTLGAMWALITGLALNFPELKAATTFFARAQNLLTVLFAASFLVAFMAIPLGMPLFIFLMMVDWDWRAVLDDQEFIYGLVSIGALSLIGALRHYQVIDRLTPEHPNVKRDFGILMTRWVIVLMVIYWIGFFLGPLGAYVMVLGYAAATVASEVYPERFANLLGRPSSKKGG